MKLLELWNAKDSLNKLLSCEVSVDKAFAIVEMRKKIIESLEACNEVRNGIIKRLGVKLPNGSYDVPGLDDKAYMKHGWTEKQCIEVNEKLLKEITEVFEKEVEIKIVKVTRKELSANKISANDLAALDSFIEG